MSESKNFHGNTVAPGKEVGALVGAALDAGEGLLRLSPTWVPRSFLHPGKRIKLAPGDWYAYGAHRGGIDERWFASTTDAANENRVWHEGQSFVRFGEQLFLLKEGIASAPDRLIGSALFQRYGRWPVYSKFFDNMGPIPHHMHQSQAHAKLVGWGVPKGAAVLLIYGFFLVILVLAVNVVGDWLRDRFNPKLRGRRT